jgi:hypothetical protein
MLMPGGSAVTRLRFRPLPQVHTACPFTTLCRDFHCDTRQHLPATRA